jgi:hypothetical protein
MLDTDSLPMTGNAYVESLEPLLICPTGSNCAVENRGRLSRLGVQQQSGCQEERFASVSKFTSN